MQHAAINWADPYTYCGIVGALLILLGFYRTSIGRWTNKSFWYELDNLTGAVLVVIYQLHVHAYVTIFLNIVWAVVAFRGLTSFAERSRNRKSHKRSRR